MDYGKSFFEGAGAGYHAVAGVQKAARWISGQWIGQVFCQRPPLKQLIDIANDPISKPVQSLAYNYSIRPLRASTEEKIRPLVQENLRKSAQTLVPLAQSAAEALAKKSSRKDQLKEILIPALQAKLLPLCKSESLTKTLSINAVDILVESAN